MIILLTLLVLAVSGSYVFLLRMERRMSDMSMSLADLME